MQNRTGIAVTDFPSAFIHVDINNNLHIQLGGQQPNQ